MGQKQYMVHLKEQGELFALAQQDRRSNAGVEFYGPTTDPAISWARHTYNPKVQLAVKELPEEESSPPQITLSPATSRSVSPIMFDTGLDICTIHIQRQEPLPGPRNLPAAASGFTGFMG
jgi:hypothetical protein